MAIDRMQRVTFLVPSPRAADLMAALQQLRLVHVEDAGTRFGTRLRRTVFSAESVEARLGQLELIEEVFGAFAPAKRPFAEKLVTVPACATASEMQQAAEEVDIDRLYDECRRISEEVRAAEKAIPQAEAEIAALEFYARLPFELSDLHSFRRAHVWIGSLNVRKWAQLQGHPWAAEHLAVQELVREKRLVHLCVLALASERERAAAVLKEYDFLERPLLPPGGPATERITLVRRRVEELREGCRRGRGRVVELSAQRREVRLLRGYWLAELAKARAVGHGTEAKRISVFWGYVRARDVGLLKESLAQTLPEVSIALEDPSPNEKVPVSITTGRLLKPMRFLIDMFGLPDYFSFDPTAYLSVGFLIFFGFCFSDVLYGIMLCVIAGYLARKARHYEGLHNFCMLLLYAGIGTILFGVLMGSWGADLPKYLGEGNFLQRLQEHTALLDPLDKPMVVLMVALALGVLNQFFGIALKGYGSLRRGDLMGAIFDAGLWLLTLPGFLLIASTLFLETPPWALRLGLALFGVGALGLVLTQGRHERGIAGKCITGFVSLYGILGSYGCVSFMGDVLSYSRLLALGLTTSVVGMAFNMMAGMLRQVHAAGPVLFVAMLLFGHAFNFAISILGSFIHPARLIFLEFFGRFYEGGAVRFRPLSPDSDQVMVVSS